MTAIRCVVSDFGGVLTTPLLPAFASFQQDIGVSPEAFRAAMARAAAAEDDGRPPLYALERGEMTEPEFMRRMEVALRAELDRDVSMREFSERFFAALQPNQALLEHYRSLRERGLRLAMITNNVREWEHRWRPLWRIDELFEVVVDSGFVGMRKPEPGIYELLLERVGLRADECVFVDDVPVNVEAAARLGFKTVLHHDTDATIAELEQLLAG